jgi:hypothetical protein
VIGATSGSTSTTNAPASVSTRVLTGPTRRAHVARRRPAPEERAGSCVASRSAEAQEGFRRLAGVVVGHRNRAHRLSFVRRLLRWKNGAAWIGEG